MPSMYICKVSWVLSQSVYMRTLFLVWLELHHLAVFSCWHCPRLGLNDSPHLQLTLDSRISSAAPQTPHHYVSKLLQTTKAWRAKIACILTVFLPPTIVSGIRFLLGACFFHRFSGSIPSELGRLNSLSVLHFDSAAGLTGTIPSELGALTKLTSLTFRLATRLRYQSL